MAFKILITDSASPLALALLEMFENREHAIVCPDFSLDDWCDVSRVKSLLSETQPAVFINTLQCASPELSEANPSLYQVAAEQCAELQVRVIHLSSHEVFSVSQQKGKPMLERGIPEPDSSAGEMYLSAENAFTKNPYCLVLRLPWLLDIPGGALDKTLHELVYGDSVQGSQNWFGSFISLREVARVVIAIAQQILCESSNWGVAHVHSSDACSELEFIDYLQRLLEKSGCASVEVNQVSNEHRMMATNGWLAGDRCTNGFGIHFRSWRHGIKSKVESWIKHQAEQKVLVLKSD